MVSNKKSSAKAKTTKNPAAPERRRHNSERGCWILAIVLIVIVVTAVVTALVMILLNRGQNENGKVDDKASFVEDVRSDALRFKQEYEALNNTVRESDGATYGAIEISENNPIIYITPAEALEILDDDQAVIYVGAEWCPWCRNAVPVLLDVAEQYGVEKLYYLNLDDAKSEFKVENGELVQTRKGTEDYYKLLDELQDLLRDYVLMDQDSETYPTGEKRIYQPHVFGIKNGAVVANKSGTVELDDGQTKYDALTSAQKGKLREEYAQLFRGVYGEKMETCSTSEQTCD